MIDTEVRPAQTGSRWPLRLRAALAGVLAAAVSLGVAELLAGLIGPNSSPVVAVGSAFIDATPRPLKDFAIATFGENDKIALVVGTLSLIVLFAVALGLLSLRDRRIGVAGIALFGAVGALAAISRPTGTVLDTIPAVVGAVAGVVALLAMLAPLSRPAPDDSSAGAAAPGPPGGLAESVRTAFVRHNRKSTALDRRGFFIVGGIAAGVAAVTGGAGTLLQRRFSVDAAREALTLPAAADPAAAIPSVADLSTQVPGLTPLYTPNADFYRVDVNITVPQVSPEDWSLRIHGRVRNELTFTLDDLIARPDVIERDITMTCVSNTVGGDLVGAARWLGVPLANLLAEAGVEDGADQVLTTAVDGFTIGTPTRDCLDTPNAMLAFAMNGQPLPAEHGFPVRMLVPGLYGYVSATKWLVDMELTTFEDAVPYWVQREWAVEGPIKISSRIDVPASVGTKAGDLTIAGVAWAQTRGIAAVEVRIDGGDWQQAELAPETNVQMWRQWRLPWRATAGQHTLTVRATGQDGEAQTDDRADAFPAGASGWHTLQVFIQ
ncbi:MAG: molybdopterin-dependent oxidoreductase [Actinomycetota bacterium]|nr:molybdopterin-dependent oxidoreductase [Actinomycetota bacterium]